MKKIGEIKGIPVVEGNINEVTKNQIHYKEGGGSIQLSKRGNDNKLNSVTGSSSGSSSKYAPRYFSIDWSKCSESWKYILSTEHIDGMIYANTIGFVATIKTNSDTGYIIGTGSYDPYDRNIAFSYIPVSMSDYVQEALGIQYQMPFNINDLIEFINKLIKDVMNLDIAPISMEGITEITEEEYYKID